MNILSKFNTFEVKQTDRISKEDKEFCEEAQKVYNNTLTKYKQWYDIYHNTEYTDEQREKFKYSILINPLGICEQIDELQKSFENCLYNYFRTKYQIDIKIGIGTPNSNYNYRTKTMDIIFLDYNDYIDDIISQLGGLTFEELQTQQFKEKVRGICKSKWSDDWYFEIKGETLKFKRLICWRYDGRWDKDYNIYSGDTENYATIISALRKFDNSFGDYQEINMLFRGGFRNFSEIESLISVNSNKVKQIKLFKNGRVDIKFTRPEYCRRFTKEWCLYNVIV